jgi:hypothetical protein
MAPGHTFAGMRTVRILTPVVTLLVLASCGNAKPQAAETTTTSTSAAQTTTVASTTTAVAPSSTAFAVTTTTLPSTTTTVVADQTEAVKQAILDFEIVRVACLADPMTCDPATFAAGAQLDAEREFAAEAITRRAHLSTRAEDPAYWVFESVTISVDRRTAIVQGCHWDTDIVSGPGPVIVNDENVSQHDTVTLNFDGSRWWLTRKDARSYRIGVNDCGPRS